MDETSSLGSSQSLRTFTKDAVLDGKPIRLDCVEINQATYAITGKLVRLAALEQEWYEDVNAPCSVIAALRNSECKPDIFTFWQRLPEVEPKYTYYTEWESIAALSVISFDHWWTKQITDKTRNMVRKSKKAGVHVREACYDDAFVRGVTDIFNETPVRQGRQFWHFGKDFETVKRQFSRFLFREELIGAYYEDELVGFAMLANAGKYGVLGQIISKIEHRDKAINNALMAKCVEECERKQLGYLVYAYWDGNSLSDFKRHCGFENIKIPRYYVPLTLKGSLALKLGFHHSLKNRLPIFVKKPLKKLRRFWLDRIAVNRNV